MSSSQEARESETQLQQQHSRSNPEKESSPKRSRRDGKPATERNSSSSRSLDIVERTDEDQKHRRRLQDALPLEAPLDEPESKVGPDAANREVNKTTDGPLDGSKHSSHPVEVSRSRSFFQHDERGSAEQSGRSVGRKTATDHRLGSSSKDRPIDRVGDRMNVQKLQQRDDRSQARDDNKVWRHDGFFELEADAPNPGRKRAFREKKLEFESANAEGGTSTEPDRASRLDRSFSGNTRREERGDRPRELDRYGRSFAGDRVPPHRGETHRPSFSPRERFSSSNSFRGRDRVSGRPGERNEYRPNSFRAEKWKHDLYDEANRSPTPKNEEDQIAKVEALLAL